jgi:hypothetical protein
VICETIWSICSAVASDFMTTITVSRPLKRMDLGSRLDPPARHA